MSFDFSDQQDLLSVLLGDSNTGSDDAFPLAIRKKMINRGELHFAKDSKSLLNYATSTVSSGEITVPSDWLETFTLIVNNYTVKNDREVSISDYERYNGYSGQPPFYYYWQFSGTRKIKFFGDVNGQTYYIYYFAKPTTELSSDSDTSWAPEEYREASVYWAAFELLQQQGKNQIADRYFQKYTAFVQSAKSQIENQYITKIYATPDLNIIGPSNTDIQGHGW